MTSSGEADAEGGKGGGRGYDCGGGVDGVDDCGCELFQWLFKLAIQLFEISIDDKKGEESLPRFLLAFLLSFLFEWKKQI